MPLNPALQMDAGGDVALNQGGVLSLQLTQADFLARLKSVLPTGWFPAAGSASGTSASPTPILDAVLSGCAAVLFWAYSLLQYALAQTRLPTATDAWLELAALDYFGAGKFPRVVGESDGNFGARIQANLIPHANTRAVISSAVQKLTGAAPRMIEPWNPADTGTIDGVWTPTWDQPGLFWDQPGTMWDSLALKGAIFLDIDTAKTPGRITDPGLGYQGFLECGLPTPPLLGGNALPCIDVSLYSDIAGSSMFDFPGAVPLGEQEVYDAINAVKPLGVVVWTRFQKPVTSEILINQGGKLSLNTGGDIGLNA